MVNLIFNFSNRIFRRLRRLCFLELNSLGKRVVFGKGVRIDHPECVRLGDDVYLNDFCWISIVKKNVEVGMTPVLLTPRLEIGQGTYVGRFGTIACINKISIGRDVLISDRVFIGDLSHGFKRIDLPIKSQYLHSKGPVSIGDGTWIGIGVSILPNVNIGKNCVVGAGSVVNHDVPDYAIVAGVPAKIVGFRSQC